LLLVLNPVSGPAKYLLTKPNAPDVGTFSP
jgi:hypothetical protein